MGLFFYFFLLTMCFLVICYIFINMKLNIKTKIKVKSIDALLAKYQVDNCNIANRSDEDSNGTKANQFVGTISEDIIREQLGLPDKFSCSGFDSGIDLRLSGMTFDVKSQQRKNEAKPHYVVNLMASQLDSDLYLNDYYIFTSLITSTSELQYLGWISKSDFKALATFYPKGDIRYRSDGSSFVTRAAMYELQINKLNK